MNGSRPTFSLCMIVKNEMANLHRSLAPVIPVFDEAIVVDTGSSDGTPKAARSLGARVVEIAWPDDFAAARNVSIDAASGDWIMWLDGDNHVAPEDVEELRYKLDHQKQSIFWCTEVVAPEGERLIQKRVFPRRPEVRFEGRVHEQLVHPADYRSVLTDVEILHWGYADKASARAKGLRNLALLQEMAAGQSPDFYVCYQLGRTLLNLRRFEEALTWLEKASTDAQGLKTNTGLFLHGLLLQAQTLSRLNRPEEAERTLQSLIGQAPEYGPAHFSLGRLAYAGRDYTWAAMHLRTFLRLGPGDPVAGFNPVKMRFTAAMLLGKCLENLDRPAEAEEAYRRADEADPANPEPRLALAALALDRGRAGQARTHLDRALKISPDNRRAAHLAQRIAAHG